MADVPEVIQQQIDALAEAQPHIRRAARILRDAAPENGRVADLADEIERKAGHCQGTAQRLRIRHEGT